MDDQPTTQRLGTCFASPPRASVTIRAICATESRPAPRTNERGSHVFVTSTDSNFISWDFKALQPGKVSPPASGGAEFGAGNSPRGPTCAPWRRGFRGKRKQRLREAIVAVEFEPSTHRTHRPPRHRACDDHCFAQPGDLQLEKPAGRSIWRLSSIRAMICRLRGAVSASVRDMRHGEPRKPLQNAKPSTAVA